jgi:hypothetical protein
LAGRPVDLRRSLGGRYLRTGRLAFAVRYKGCHELDRICADDVGDSDEFYNIDPALPAFVFSDKGLGFFDTQLVPIIRRQIRSAERIIELTRHGRIKLRRYEQNIEIDG